MAGQYDALVHSDTVAAPLEAAHSSNRTVSRGGIGRDGGCAAGDGEAVLGDGCSAASVDEREQLLQPGDAKSQSEILLVCRDKVKHNQTKLNAINT